MIKTTLICKIFFRLAGSSMVESIIGEIKTRRLFYKDNEWVLIKTKHIFQSKVISENFPIHKGDICQIERLEPCESLTIDNQDLKISEFPFIANNKEKQNTIICEGL